MEKLKEIIGIDQYNKLNKGIDELLNIEIDKGFNSVLLDLDEPDVIRYINNDSFPSCEVEVEERQITAETIAYFPTGMHFYKPINIFSPISVSEFFDSVLLITKDYIFELTAVVISKQTNLLTFGSSKSL